MAKSSGTAPKAASRKWVTIPVTPAQKQAILQAARSLGINVTNYGRMRLLKDTGYDPKADPDFPTLRDEE